jgi:hypothetical protein
MVEHGIGLAKTLLNTAGLSIEPVIVKDQRLDGQKEVKPPKFGDYSPNELKAL